MYQYQIRALLKTNLLILILILTIGLVGILGLTPSAMAEVTAQTSTSTPTPTAIPTPNRTLGINFWNESLVKEIFLPGTRGQLNGYVLLDQSDLGNSAYVEKVEGALNAGLMPIFRIDAGSGYAVPVDPDNFKAWIDDFKKHIENTYSKVIDAYPQGPVLYIVGNEPRLEDGAEGKRFGENGGGISAEEYATAYAALWQEVHQELNEGGTPKYPHVVLLVAGQAFHVQDTHTWAATVSTNIVEKQADVDGYALHTYGYGTDAPSGSEECGDPQSNCDGLSNPPENWGGDDSFLNYIDQLDAINDAGFGDRPVYITEFNTFTGATPDKQVHGPNVPSGNYPTDLNWIGEAAEHVATDGRVQGLLWFVGPAHGGTETQPDWQYFALKENHYRLDCARRDFRSVAQGKPREGCIPEASAPKFHSAPYFVQCQMEGIVMIASDNESGLDKITVVASPAQTYDLSQTEPGQIIAGILDIVPQVGGFATLTLSDHAGNITQQQVYNSGQPASCAGGDHPDDNHSDASSLLPGGQFFTLPAGARTTARVAVLQRGFAAELWLALFSLGEPAALINSDFDPAATARQYPVLFIPSGGLYGVENSLIFKKRLELYAAAGGTIIAFAQQHGYEFNALPGAAGEQGSGGAGEISPPLSGYGWQEDNSCYEASLLLSANHPILSGFSQTALTAHVDGYSWG